MLDIDKSGLIAIGIGLAFMFGSYAILQINLRQMRKMVKREQERNRRYIENLEKRHLEDIENLRNECRDNE